MGDIDQFVLKSGEVCDDLRSILVVDIPSPDSRECSYEECRELCFGSSKCQGWTWLSDVSSQHYGQCKLAQLSSDSSGTLRAITGQRSCQGRQSPVSQGKDDPEVLRNNINQQKGGQMPLREKTSTNN